MEKEELTQLFNFFREIDKEKFIGRQTYLTDGVRKENDAEHAWHMAIMTVLLAGYADEKIDVLKTVTMLLIHTPFSFLTPCIRCFITSSMIIARSSLVLPSGTSSRYINTVTKGACPLQVISVIS